MGLLNIVNQNSGDFDPYVKYNANSGRWTMKDDSGAEVEIDKPTFVADFDNIKTGWLYFREGAAPERVFDADLRTPATKPDKTYVDDKGKTRDCFNRGFQIRLFSGDAFGGVVELSSSSMHMCNAINELYEAYDNDKQDGKLPVVSYTGYTPMKDKFGTNYKPNFEIVKWVDRPEAFDAAPAQAEAAPEPAAVANTGASEF